HFERHYHHYRSLYNSRALPITKQPNHQLNKKPSIRYKGMVRLGRNQSLPAPSNHGATLRKVSTNVFSFPSLNLTRTSSERSISTPTPSYSPLASFGNNGSSSRSSSKSRGSRSRPASTIVPLAPIISAIQRGNFMLLSDVELDYLIRDMTGKDSKVLETLNITGASVSSADAKILAKLIKSSDAANIKTLKMENSTISQQATKTIFEAWKFNRTITSLSLARSGVNDKTVKYLARVLAKNETIRTLDLSGNQVTHAGAEHLADALLLNRGINRLCLQSNNIKKAGAPHLARILAKNRIIRHLNIASNGLGPDGVTLIAEAVRFNRTLNSLSLDMNEMGPKGAAALAIALVSNRHLTHLYLAHNNIGDKGLVDLCLSLHRNRFLNHIDLELNHIGQGDSDLGLKALAKVLKTNSSLRELNLSFNLLSTASIEALASGMAGNTTLESVLLDNCRLSTESAIAIAKVLSSTTGLQNLCLTNNPDIGVDGYWALASNLVRNRSLKGLQLDYNSEDRQSLYDSFQNSLTRNHIWQQAIYSAACRILVLSRIVLLGLPANQKLLQQQQQHHIQHHLRGWKLIRKVLGRTNSSTSISSLLSIGKGGNSSYNNNSNSNGDNSTSHCNRSNHGSISCSTNLDKVGQFELDISPSNTSVSNTQSRLSFMPSHNQVSDSNSSGNAQNKIVHRQSSNSSLFSGGQRPATHGLTSSISTVSTLVNPTPSHHRSPSIATTSGDSQHTYVGGHITYEYNPHKILANLGNMPYEIFENICAFLDPGRTMTIAQIRATVQAAGERSTLTRYYTRERMLEYIFNSRYISPVGTRYSLKPGDERY
ncbi:hypothetical protein BGZ94_007567, partial [Podila epigama]